MSDAIYKAMARADGMVARAKAAASSPLASIIGERPFGDPDTRVSNAAEQYKHNRRWVFSCVRLVAQKVAGQRICVARQTAAKNPDVMITKSLRDSLPLRMKGMADHLEPLDSHPILDLLADPSSLGVAAGLMLSTTTSLELTGRSLWYLTEEEAGGRLSILPIPTSWIEDVDRARTTWKIRLPGASQSLPIPGDRCVYFFYPSPDNPWGAQSTLAAIGSAVNSDHAIAEAQWKTFSQGQWPGLILTVGKMENPLGGEGMRPTLTDAQRRQLITTVKAATSGILNRNEPAIVDGMVEKIERLTFTPQELDFLESAKLPKEMILAAWHVSEILLGAVQNANRASAGAAAGIFYENKINPLLELMSQTLTAWLGPMFAKPGEKLVIWFEKAVADDEDMLLKKWTAALTRGAVDDDEFRVHVLNIAARTKPKESAAEPAAAVAAPAAADIQATALNGAQIDSLLNIAQLVADGTLTRAAAKALIEASFPLLTAEQINSIVNSLEVNPATSPTAATLAKAINPYTLKRVA